MDPVLSAALRSWDWRAEIILILAFASILYSVGWWRLRKRTSDRHGFSRWQAAAKWRPSLYLGGLLLLAIALMSPIDVLSSYLFTAHMIQHLLLVMVIPPLIQLANPLPFLLWGLPSPYRLAAGSWFGPRSRLRRTLKHLTGVGIIWLAYVIIIWGWHDPNAYNIALQNSIVHDLQHLSFFVVAMLFWWHIIGAGPRIHRRLSPLARFDVYGACRSLKINKLLESLCGCLEV
jgi:cytochrome c oxidase assembly factor CtaG